MSRLLRDAIQVILLELHALHEYQPHSPDVTRVELLEWLEQCGFSVFHVAGHVWEHLSGLKTHLEQGRFAYVPVTAATRQQLLYDRPVEILMVASKTPDTERAPRPAGRSGHRGRMMGIDADTVPRRRARRRMRGKRVLWGHVPARRQ
jgi:hypothetical protein